MQICRLLHPSCYRQLCHGVRISLLLTTVETTMAEWKYEICVRLHISGTIADIVSDVVGKLNQTTAVDEIKASFRVKGKDFATAVQTVEVDKGFLSSDATVVICVTLNRKGFLEARAGKRFGNVIGVAVPIDKILKEEVEKAYKAKDEAGLFMKVRTVKVKITKEGAW